jgi:uncharacterized secreted protein with C-terminal beta-propeller domain
MKKNKIVQLIIFCLAIVIMIFLPAMISMATNLYTSVIMQKTGSLPTVDKYEKLEKLVGSNRYTYNRYDWDFPVVDYFEPARSIGTSKSLNSIDSFSRDDLVTSSTNSLGSKTSSYATQSSSSSDYSTTNTQVTGVDEADILKNDGKYIYTISGNKLVIIDAFPADKMQKVSEIKIENDYSLVELYVSGDKLFLITDTNNKGYYYYSKRDVKTKMLVYNIVDRAKPELIKTFEVKGTYTSSRKIDDKVYVFTNLSVYKEGDKYIVPQYREGDTSNFIDVDLRDVQYVPNDNYSLYTQIFAFDMGTPLNNPKIVTYLGEGSNNIYMSRDSLYMAQSRYSETTVYKFSLASEYPRYEAKGTVEGTIINQFAMDEFDGNFRIATTYGSKSSVYILGPSMHKLGSLLNIAPGEQIKSVRFEGDRAYVVTFRNTDPLFVVDLSSVRKPQVLGELKIPGYSTYLHTYDENHVIGFGYDGSSWGTNGKLKVALFDITDVTNPKEMFTEQIDANTSELLTNHKSLLFSKEKNLIAFAVGSYWYIDGSDVGKVYTITLDKGFELRGDIKHKDDVTRMLFMDDTLYGVSEKTISAHDIETIKEIKSIGI